jgi:hypothetical protein
VKKNILIWAVSLLFVILIGTYNYNRYVKKQTVTQLQHRPVEQMMAKKRTVVEKTQIPTAVDWLDVITKLIETLSPLLVPIITYKFANKSTVVK